LAYKIYVEILRNRLERELERKGIAGNKKIFFKLRRSEGE